MPINKLFESNLVFFFPNYRPDYLISLHYWSDAELVFGGQIAPLQLANFMLKTQKNVNCD